VVIKLNALKNSIGARHRKMRVGCGRGSGKGKTCGRGQKGQFSRSGHKHKAGFEGGQMRLIRRVPKRGFNHSQKKKYALVQVSCLERFEQGTEVTFSMLREAGLANGNERVKILGNGELRKKMIIKVHAFSQNARQKIIEAGGTCEVVAYSKGQKTEVRGQKTEVKGQKSE